MTERATDEEIATRISEEIIKVHVDSYGVGAHEIKTHLLDDLVVIVIDVELTPAERTLMDAGKHDAIKTTRESYQVAIGPTFTAVVERATGRKVTSFLSHLSVEPLYAVEFFRLGPLPRYATS